RHEAKTAFTLCAHKGIDDLHPPLPVNLNDSNRTYVISTETNASSISRDTNTTFSYFTRDSKKGTVTDKKSELMWQDRKLGPIATWTSAIDRCENLNFAGYKDWRVPNFNELYRITAHDLNKTATNEAFKAIKEASFWSTTSSENDHDRAWGISFIKGNDFTYDKTEQLYSRCVRDLK
ncbi:MAG: DUF1566 domain-containing protein, partial [Thiovulaceae bacterium]|nr:DUF1566 domain-containing protein [Sulfurimonadaceae bacterium]